VAKQAAILAGSKRPSRATKGRAVAAREEKQPDESIYSGRVAARIRYLRVRENMTREQLQAQLKRQGVSVSMPALYAYENGQRTLHSDHFPAFAKALGCKSVRAFLPAE
jgi:hypothetical protein